MFPLDLSNLKMKEEVVMDGLLLLVLSVVYFYLEVLVTLYGEKDNKEEDMVV